MKDLLKTKWMWLIYLILFGAFALNKAIGFFSTAEPAHFFYQVSMIFHINNDLFPSGYVFTIAAILLNGFAFLFVWLYIIGSRYFSADFIVVMVLLRLTCDLFGSSYEWATVQSLYVQSRSLGINTGINFISWLLPSYLAMMDYIIRRVRRPRLPLR